MKVSRKLGRKAHGIMGEKSKNVLLAGIIALGSGIVLPLSAEAAENKTADTTTKAEESSASETPAYTMGEVVVTATRTEKREVDVPMATEVITEEDIKDSGATNVAEILQKVNGFTFNSLGALGAANGNMANDIVVRGNDNGTLVLVNGNPIAQRGLYNLHEIQADTVERIEIVKGGGSILYGSEAMGGVINIITKTEAANSVSVGFGNYGRQKYHLNVGGEGLLVTYDRNSFGHHDEATHADVKRTTGDKSYKGTTATDLRDIMNQSATVSYKFNDHLNFLYGHYETRSEFWRYVTKSVVAGTNPGDQYNQIENITLRDTVQLNYRDKNWKGSLYYNRGFFDKRTHAYLETSTRSANLLKHLATPTWTHAREKNTTYGFDAQRDWKIGKAKLTAGLSGQHEVFQQLQTSSNATRTKYLRNNWGVFAQWDQTIDEKNSFILGGRETWTSAAEHDYNNFSAAAQFLHKMTDKDSLFLNVSQSFIMPTLKAVHGSAGGQIPTPDLKPQKGINYEIGWKRITGKHTWKASLFSMNIKDNISATLDGVEYKYENEDFRNEGLELSYSVESKNGFSYNAGLTWQNPRSKQSGEGVNKPYWDRKLGKVQLVGGISYKKDKWRGAFNFSFLGARVRKVSAAPNIHEKPYFLTTFTLAYAPTDKCEFELMVDNVFNRHDVISKGTSPYYAAPCNFLLSFTQKF